MIPLFLIFLNFLSFALNLSLWRATGSTLCGAMAGVSLFTGVILLLTVGVR